MKKYLIISIIIVLNFIIQFTWLQHFEILGCVPNTALVIVVCFSILYGREKGGIIGFFSGILQDFFLGNVIGAHALSYMLIGYNMGILEKFIFKDNFLTPVFFTVICTIFHYFLYYLILYLIHYPVQIMMLWQKSFLIEIIYNGILAIFVYKLGVEFEKTY